jgi:hypothetical protein
VSRRLPEEFEGKELVPLCLAAKLEEAKEIEGIKQRMSEINLFNSINLFKKIVHGNCMNIFW